MWPHGRIVAVNGNPRQKLGEEGYGTRRVKTDIQGLKGGGLKLTTQSMVCEPWRLLATIHCFWHYPAPCLFSEALQGNSLQIESVGRQ